MKQYLGAGTLAAIAGAALLLSVGTAQARVPGGSYLQSCTNVRAHGDRVVATCRDRHGRWNRTALNNTDRCVGGIANSNGRLVCGMRGGRMHAGRERDNWRHERRWDHYGYRDGYGYGYGSSQQPRHHWRDNYWYGR